MLTRFTVHDRLLCLAFFTATATPLLQAGDISGAFQLIAPSSTINLSEKGALDWVHWGTYTEYAADRKAGVTPQISDFFVLGVFSPGNGPFHFADSSSGYSWMNGMPNVSVTNVTSGIYVVGTNYGVEFTAPADTTTRVLEVYVGAYGVMANFSASLSDGGIYSSTNFNYTTDGPSGVYRLTYTANSPDQVLTIDFMPVNMYDLAFGNVTLQAAALSYATENNPPTVALTSPTDSSAYRTNEPISIDAAAFDPDGTITNVQFFAGTNLIGEATGSPFTTVWSNAVPGEYLISAEVWDNAGTVSISRAIPIFIHGIGGALSGSFAPTPSAVMLSKEGGRDWVHWGLTDETSLDRKVGVNSVISNFQLIGENPVQAISDSTEWSWDDGFPTGATNSITCVFINGYTNGFELHLAAGTNQRTAKLYVGLFAAGGQLQAFLDDFSATPFIDTSFRNVYNQSSRTYTLNYSAASNNRNLIIRYTANTLFDLEFGNLTLSSVAVAGPVPIALRQPAMDGANFSFTFSTASNYTYSVDYTDSLSPQNWRTLTNFSGNGTDATIGGETYTNRQRFYRVMIAD